MEEESVYRTATFDKIDQSYYLLGQIISDLPDKALAELNSGFEEDYEKLIDGLLSECYSVLFGTVGQIKTAHFNHLDNLATSMEETLRLENFNYFVSSTLPEVQVNWHHIEWGDIIQRYLYLCIIAARDHGKSFWFDLYLTWKMYRYAPLNEGRNKDRSLSHLGYMFSYTHTQAKRLLREMKKIIENNDILRERLHPGKVGWGEEELECKNGARLFIAGFDSAVRGGHPGYILADDILKDNVIYSADQREKTKIHFQSVLMNMITPGGQVAVVGTPFHHQDLYNDFKNDSTWHYREYPAIFPDGTLLWPARHNVQSLKRKRKGQGALVFARENLCRPIDDKSTIFPYEILERSILRMDKINLVKNRHNYPVKINRVVAGCDFAISASAGADFTVFIVIGIDDAGIYYVMHMNRMHAATYGEQMAMLKSININFGPDVIFLENNQFQSIFVQEADKMGLPVKGHHTGINKNSFEKGLPSLAILFENGKIKFPYGDSFSKEMADLTFAELNSIAFTDKGLKSTTQHDDCAMALWIAISAAKYNNSDLSLDFI